MNDIEITLKIHLILVNVMHKRLFAPAVLHYLPRSAGAHPCCIPFFIPENIFGANY